MVAMDKLSWLLLLYSLPATHKTERVAVWRKLKKSGAVSIKTSTYLLPDLPAQYELFQWLAKQVKDYGGESTLIRAREIEGLSDEKLIGLFNAARDAQYAELANSLRSLNRKGTKNRDAQFAEQVETLKKEFRRIREVDFFNAPRAHDAEVLMQRIQSSARSKRTAAPKLAPKNFQGKTWVTRPRPEIDRVASAWLIRRFIDPIATFVFAPAADLMPNALPFDFPDAEFSHHGEDCSFETLLRRFSIADKALRKIGEMVHDADLGDEKFQRNECVGLDRVLKGWAKRGMSDYELLLQGAACFDGLYSFLQRL
jgi:hypothetical protein